MTGRIGRGVTTLMLLLIGGAGGAAGAVPSSADDPRQASASIGAAERVLAEQLYASGVQSGSVAVVSDERVEARGVGTTVDGSDVTADTPFVIGSATKSFTALAVMQLVDAGKVEIDARVREYVPELELAAGQPVDDITVGDILQQTSGLTDLGGGPLLASATDGTPAEAIAELKDAELASTPGETWLYANVNYVLAGLVVEDVSGLSYGDYVQREIFTPLGMTHSSAGAAPAASDVLADGHRYWFGIPVATEPTRRNATLAAGYLISTAKDLGRYLSLYLNDGLGPDGTRIISADGVRTLLSAARTGCTAGRVGAGTGLPLRDGMVPRRTVGQGLHLPPRQHPGYHHHARAVPRSRRSRGHRGRRRQRAARAGQPFIADRVTRNVVHAALAQPVRDLPSMTRFYLGFDLVAMLLLGAAAWGLRRAVRSSTSPARLRHPVRGWAGVVVGTLGAGLLVLLPSLSYGWRGLWTWAPDLAVVIAVTSLLLTAAAVLRATGLLRARRAARPADFTSTEVERHHVSA